MKKAVCIIIAICMCLTSILGLVGCEDDLYVDKSNAVSRNTFDNPEFAKEQEAKDDALGPIPDDAETIIIDGETYIPIDDIRDVHPEDYDKNFILKHDIDVTGKYTIGLTKVLFMTTGADEPFTGKFNGNNYKIYGRKSWPLFGYIKYAEISNIVFSSEMSNNYSMVLCAIAKNSIIKNIINYSTMGPTDYDRSVGLILSLYKSSVENIINYGDVVNGSACIVKYMFDSTVKNCKNYGNISRKYRYPMGAIVSEILANSIPALSTAGEATETVSSVVENCENYGNIIGKNYVGGIVGRVAMFNDTYTIGGIYYNDFTDISTVKLLSNPSVVRNCTNYGDIYRDKDYEQEPLNLTVLGCVGGIIGLGNSVENCNNYGNIYGFETINPEYRVDYIGGIAGAAREVVDCLNLTTLKVAHSIKHTSDICGYLIER